MSKFRDFRNSDGSKKGNLMRIPNLCEMCANNRQTFWRKNAKLLGSERSAAFQKNVHLVDVETWWTIRKTRIICNFLSFRGVFSIEKEDRRRYSRRRARRKNTQQRIYRYFPCEALQAGSTEARALSRASCTSPRCQRTSVLTFLFSTPSNLISTCSWKLTEISLTSNNYLQFPFRIWFSTFPTKYFGHRGENVWKKCILIGEHSTKICEQSGNLIRFAKTVHLKYLTHHK